ncbi:MAG: glycosyltransferase family 4 protein [Alphaproteobacteria bacterium]|nr:glycosyltransferase family 4 protein [Alphaproteobacteria bacterium]
MPINDTVPTPFGVAVQSPKKKSRELSGKVIVQILPALNHGGVERGTVEMAEAIIRAGGKAVVISSGGHLENRLRRCGAEHFTLPVDSKNPLKWPFIRGKVKTVLQACQADVVHSRSRAPAWIAMPAARALGIKVVTTIHGRFVASSIFKRLYNSIMTKSDRVITISNYVQGLVLNQFPAIKDKTVVIHRGVDVDLFSPKAVSAQRVINIAEDMSIPDGVPVVMLPARPTAWKGMSILIEAMGMIKDKPFLLALVGAGDGADDFQRGLIRQIETEGLQSKVRITKSINDMPAGLMLADVVVMPSITPEPFGRVAVEASAMGCPVVAFRHGGASESLVHGVTGWLAEPVSAQSLAEMISQALELKQRARKKLAADASAYVHKNFTSEKMCSSTIAVYTDLLS